MDLLLIIGLDCVIQAVWIKCNSTKYLQRINQRKLKIQEI